MHIIRDSAAGEVRRLSWDRDGSPSIKSRRVFSGRPQRVVGTCCEAFTQNEVCTENESSLLLPKKGWLVSSLESSYCAFRAQFLFRS